MTKFVPEGEYLLSSTAIKSDKKVLPSYEMEPHIKQKPNYKTFAIFKLPLFIYSLSGKDTTKWVNRTLRNAGDPPVIYDSTMLHQTVVDLKRLMTNKGYLDAEVTPEVKLHNKKADVTYNIAVGEPYRIDDYKIAVDDSIMGDPMLPTRMLSLLKKPNVLETDSLASIRILDTLLYRNSLVKKGTLFDLDMLDQERDRITSEFRRLGYYGFNKEYIGFEADTTLGKHNVGLDLSLYPFMASAPDGKVINTPHKQYRVKSVELYVDYNPIEDGDLSLYKESSTYEKNGYVIRYGQRGEYIKPHIILSSCYIVPGTMYDENMTSLTYSALSQLRILKNVNISWEYESPAELRCVITCVPDKRQGASWDVEGTNSGGAFGVGAGVGYLHRNAFRGSEQFNIKLRGAYEAGAYKSGKSSNFANFEDNYFEMGGEASLTFPRFMFPFLKKDFRRNIHASTQLNLNYTYQRRPGMFTRTVSSAGLRYIWQDRRMSLNRHIFDFINVSYVHLPKGSLDSTFYANLSESARQYSFNDHFILSSGYTFSRTNATSPTRGNRPIYSLRASVETAGNLLSLATALRGVESDSLGSKQVFGTNYAQYLRGTVDYSRTYQVDEKNSIAWRLGGGIAFPYGNSKQIPIQKRFFSGGANGVRGWPVRELGPGSYYFKPSDIPGDSDNFYYHSGDIRLDASIEYRSKLFWIIELAAFIDAGNIWTIREYDKQEGGVFKLDSFYKEIAFAWGLGLRLDFNYVLLRLDCGWKAYDPSNDPNTKRWPILQPHKFSKNVAWHIAVGYPF
ncbi:BamA/TamA family outer membrane protein [Dysgonomonas sp. Marseille-P4361]|uniref:translocation and assembly module lipoprotein TamL n=1 Tax=Dysgonomonas sp. Marseille-P4361 TaxID=2161820 RepID=UPI0021011580|nr:BamA/TamA family outer membrane protein [Dysgonomonas sp. Marseille-P4361]